MRSKLVWSFLGLVALATGGMISGCDGDAAIAKSGVGESCDSSADCEDSLNCIQGACYQGSAVPGGGEGGENDPGVVGPIPPVLGGEGESCTKRADCEDGLACFNQRCSKDLTGEGGEGNIPTIRLGKLGETCSVSSDCEDSLACVPGGQEPGVPYGFVGVCEHPVGDLVPSGKSCGAECVDAADCCELPLALHVPYAAVVVVGVPGAPYGTGANSCAELTELIGASRCTAAATGALAARCFAQAAYCEACDDTTWSCEAGKCSYTASCSKDGPLVGGCPDFSRAGYVLYPVCDTDTELCQPAVGDPICTRDTDCETVAMADTGEVCAADECVCYQETACYRRCDNTLDCSPGFVCGDDSVCVAAPQCTTNAECAGKFGGRSACFDGVCQTRCASNYECSEGGNGPSSLVCNAEGFCETLGCTNDDQCSTGGDGISGVRLFCTANPEPGMAGVRSAITD